MDIASLPALELTTPLRPNPGCCRGAADRWPQQCKAARAGLGWSREQLAERAGIAERTFTEFGRQASNMFRKNKVALRKAFEAAGVSFDVAMVR
jgi:DNA-binding XRE family transcriptional regulator